MLPQYTKNPKHLHSKLRFCFWIEICRCYPSIQKIQNISIQNSDFLSELKSADVTPVSQKSKTFAFKAQIFFLNWNLQMLPQYQKNPKHLHSKLRFSLWIEICRCYPSMHKFQNICIQNSDFLSKLKSAHVTPVYKKSKTFVFKTQISFRNWNLQMLSQYTKNPKHLYSKLRFSFWIEISRCYPSIQNIQNISIQNSDFLYEL